MQKSQIQCDVLSIPRLLNSLLTVVDRNWVKMNKADKDMLYDKIQGEWNLPRLVDGLNVKRVLSSQCAALYHGWRYCLKEKYYIGYSIADANKSAGIDKTKWDWLINDFWSDPIQQRISEKAKRNKSKQTVMHSNGAMSTARILEELINVPVVQPQESPQDGEESPELELQHPEEPIYVRLYEKTHRHVKTGLMEPDAEATRKALRELREKEIQEHGVDNLTPQKAFPKVLKECSGYIRGLGAGPKPLKKPRSRADSDEVITKIEQLQQVASERENALRAEIEQQKQESLEKENRL